MNTNNISNFAPRAAQPTAPASHPASSASQPKNTASHPGISAPLSVVRGQTLEGTVVETSANRALIRAGGQTILAQTSSELTAGQSVLLRVVEVADGQIFAERVDSPEYRILSRIGAPLTPENAAIVEELAAADLPATAANFQTVRQMVGEARFVRENLGAGALPVDSPLDQPLRSLVLSLLSGTEADERPERPNLTSPQSEIGRSDSGPSERSSEPGQSVGSTPLSAFGSGGDASAPPAAGGDVRPVFPGAASQHLSQESFVRVLLHELTEPGSTKDEDLALAVRSLLREFAPKTAVRLMRSDLSATLRNILSASLEPSAGVDRWIALAKTIPRLGEQAPEILDALSEEPDRILPRLETIVSKISGSAGREIRESLAVIREQAAVSKQPDAPVYYMPVPIRLDNDERRVDLYFKRRGKRGSRDEFHVLVALRTDRFGEVRCVVSKLGKRFELAFGLESARDAAHFESRRLELSDALKDREVVIRFRAGEEIETEFFHPPAKPFGFDRRV